MKKILNKRRIKMTQEMKAMIELVCGAYEEVESMSEADKMLSICGWEKYSESDYYLKYRRNDTTEIKEIHIGLEFKKVYRSFDLSDIKTEIAIMYKMKELGWLNG